MGFLTSSKNDNYFELSSISTPLEASKASSNAYKDTSKMPEKNKPTSFEDSHSGFRADQIDTDGTFGVAIQGTDITSFADLQAADEFGRSQFESTEARGIVDDAIDAAKAGKDVQLTGHSMGGGVATKMGYNIQAALMDHPNAGKVSVTTFGALGLKTAAEALGLDLEPDVLSRMDITNFNFESDPITGWTENYGQTVSIPDRFRTKQIGRKRTFQP